MKRVKIFISSPADAIQERNRITRVIDRLNTIYLGIASLESIRWEDDFYQAHQTFQTQIPEAKNCDIVVGILKFRLGSPLPSDFPPMPTPDPFNGQRYPSGTAYEILSSIANRLIDGEGKPDVYIFRNADPPSVRIGSDEIESIDREWRRLEDFIRRFFFTAEGEFRFAFQAFRSTDMFEAQVESLLQKWIRKNIYADRRVLWPVETRGSPFRALDVFDFEHRDVFFGREREIARGVQQLTDASSEQFAGAARLPFLLVIGPSGAGKSSLIRAGLVPTITGSGAGQTDEWRVAVFRPAEFSSTPLEALAAVLLGYSRTSDSMEAPVRAGPPALPELAEMGHHDPAQLCVLFRNDKLAAVRVITDALDTASRVLASKENFERQPSVRLLLVVDQLDELFAAGLDEERRVFSNVLRQLLESGSVWVVSSLRAGLFELLLNDAPLASLKTRGTTLEIGAPGVAEIAEIVRKPAEAANLIFEKDADGVTLDERVLKDFDRPDMLPLLQFALDAVFQKSIITDNGRLMTHRAYNDINGVAGSIKAVADAATDQLAPAVMAHLPELLRALMRVGDMRSSTVDAPVTLIDAPIPSVSRSAPLSTLITALASARLLVLGKTGDGIPTVRIAHQRTLALWPPFANAMAANKFFHRVLAEVEQAYARWMRNGRNWRQLIRDPVLLSESIRLANGHRAELDSGLRSFILRSRLRARMGVIAASAAAFTFAGLAVSAFLFYRQAETNFGVALKTLNGVVTDVADGLRNTEGMSVTSRAKILERVQRSADELRRDAGDDTRLLETRWMMLTSFGDSYWAGGDGERAMSAYREGLQIGQDLTREMPQNVDWRRAVSVNFERLGDIDLARGQRKEALKNFEDAANIRRRLSNSDPSNTQWQRDVSVSLDRLGDVRSEIGDTVGALEAYDGSLSIVRKLQAGDESRLQWQRDEGVILGKIGDIHLTQGNTQAALSVFQTQLLITEKNFSQDPDNIELRRDVLVSHTKLGDIYISMGDRDQGLVSYGEALKTARRLLSLDPQNVLSIRDVGVSLTRLADAQLDQGEIKAAIAGYQEGLDTARRLVARDPANMEWQRDVELELNRIAKARLTNGEMEAALKTYSESLAMARALLAKSPEKAMWKADISATLQRIGDVQFNLGRYSEALTSSSEALVISRELSMLSPSNAEWRRSIALGLHRTGDVRFATGDLDAALAAYKESLGLMKALSATDPKNIGWARDVSVSLNRMGKILLAKNRVSEAAATFEESLSVNRSISTADPLNLDRRRDVAVGSNLVGDVRQAAGDKAGARLAYNEGLETMRSLLAAVPDNITWKRDLAFSLGKVGDLAFSEKRNEEAEISYREALELSRAVAAAHPDDDAQSRTDLVIGLFRLSSVTKAPERPALLREALVITQKLELQGLLSAQQHNWFLMLRDALKIER